MTSELKQIRVDFFDNRREGFAQSDIQTVLKFEEAKIAVALRNAKPSVTMIVEKREWKPDPATPQGRRLQQPVLLPTGHAHPGVQAKALNVIDRVTG